MTEEEIAHCIATARHILGSGADEAQIGNAFFDHVQWAKGTDKRKWSKSGRYNLPVIKEQRDAAKRAVAGLRKALTALRPVVRQVHFAMEDGKRIDLAYLESVQSHLETIERSDVRPGSSLDPRKRVAVRQAAELLKSVGKPLSKTRGGDLDTLSAALWGDTDADFQEYVIEYLDHCSQSVSD